MGSWVPPDFYLSAVTGSVAAVRAGAGACACAFGGVRECKLKKPRTIDGKGLPARCACRDGVRPTRVFLSWVRAGALGTGVLAPKRSLEHPKPAQDLRWRAPLPDVHVGCWTDGRREHAAVRDRWARESQFTFPRHCDERQVVVVVMMVVRAGGGPIAPTIDTV